MIILSAHADDETGAVVKAKVLSIETRGEEMVYRISTAGDDKSTLRFCPELNTAPIAEILREAYRLGDSIELTSGADESGPCLISVRISKGA